MRNLAKMAQNVQVATQRMKSSLELSTSDSNKSLHAPQENRKKYSVTPMKNGSKVKGLLKPMSPSRSVMQLLSDREVR